ncbi:acetyl esterase/lipase [Raoultella sp. BIGb0138]|uniref:alpha/beta hydrolase n=1 Tax=Raoultella sp. BIGb0138 TaxID=2485115 RepID=UPI0010513ED6|nr:alpha/beta hydrolase [Raoultella sp. BIGb0138]TCW17418.1 acetyl esterase/lipase [Raoultella sp. BIGb0138]
MNRRHFLLFSAAALLLTQRTRASGRVEETLPLWPGEPPGGGGPSGAPRLSARGALSHIARPSLSVWRPAVPNGHGVLVAAGGGYRRIEMAKEAWPAADWLTARGYTAYVLSYRLPGEGWGAGAPAPLQDAQRALRLIARREKKVSLLGFSAGGHLLGMAACRADFVSYPPTDALDARPARAAGAALIYPVISLMPPYSHTATHRILAGPHASAAVDRAWSVQTYVDVHTPPCFLVQAEDDPVSDPHNTVIMAGACRQHQVPVSLYRYARGGHGFAMGRPGTPTVAWPEHYAGWLRER